VQKNLTPEQYRLALIDSPDPKMQQMGVELGLRQTRLDELDQKLDGGVKSPMAAMPAPMTAPVEAPAVAPIAEKTTPLNIQEVGDYRIDRNISLRNQAKLINIAGKEPLKIGPNEYFGENIGGGLEIKTLPTVANALAAQVAPVAPVANALVAQPAAPVGNAMAAKQAQIAEINRKLNVLNSPRYSDLTGVKGQIDTLERQLKQLTESPVGKPDAKDFTVKSLAAYAASGDLNDLVPKTDERLAFDKTKFEWEKANPNKTLKEIVQNGVTKYFSVDDRSGVATPVTVAGGKILSGTDMASQRLAFDQAKFAWEKANPGFTIQQAEDGSIVGVNNRTLQAYPVNLNAGPPPSTAPFTGGGVAAPSAGAGRGSVTVTDGQMPPVSVPLKGKAAGLNESQSNATAFGMRMKDSHAILEKLENKGISNTGVVGGTAGAVVGLVPLIGDKLTAGVDNIYNVLPEVLGGYSAEQQQVLNGRINFISAVLRKESGASIQPSEFSLMERLYFPRPGDLPPVIKQKQNARNLAIQAMKIQAGPGAKSIDSLGTGTESESDPLGIRK
jgi:hypothetical protein